MNDADRLRWLHEHGYLPNVIPIDFYFKTATEFLDWALLNKYGPAYWRKPKDTYEIKSVMPPYGNGLVYVTGTDRARIDELMSK